MSSGRFAGVAQSEFLRIWGNKDVPFRWVSFWLQQDRSWPLAVFHDFELPRYE
jgi:hypothetical protein